MSCVQCGTVNSAGAEFCQKCGTSQSTDANPSNPKTGALWNPNAAANWSYVFTPAFGAYVQMLNWKTLGQADKAASAKVWFYVSLVMLVVFIGMNAFLPNQHSVGGAASGLAILYLLVWYFIAGRGQAKYVKEKFGSAYPRKSWLKPLLIGLVAMIAYAVISMTAVSATGKLGGGDGSSVAESLRGMISGSSEPNCASADVKNMITDQFTGGLVATGIPDLVTAIADNRIKFRVEMITETGRNADSQFVLCNGNLVAEFPKEDLEKAKKLAAGSFFEKAFPSDPIFTSRINYKVSIPADKEERKTGPIIEAKEVDAKASKEVLRWYTAAYGALASTVADITATTKNSVKWDKAFKEGVVEECSKQYNPELCRCRLDQFEQLLNQLDMQRMGYFVQTKSLDAKKYPNFIALSDSLATQCPPNKNVAALLESTPPSAAVQQVAESVPAPSAVQPNADSKPEVVSSPDAAKSSVEASFDCTKASSKIEKLICSSPETASADKRLSIAYSTARAKSGDDPKLKADQRIWMKEQRNSCDDAACLLNVTEKRIQSLSQM